MCGNTVVSFLTICQTLMVFFLGNFVNSVYDARRSEAIRSLEETKSKRDTIDSMLSMISCRIQDLKSEQHEFEECLQLETEKSCLTTAIAKKELLLVTENLKELKEKNSMCESQAQDVQKQMEQIYQAAEKDKFLKNKEEQKLQEFEKSLTCLKEKLEKTLQEESRQSLKKFEFKKQKESLESLFESSQSKIQNFLTKNQKEEESLRAIEEKKNQCALDHQKLEEKIASMQENYPGLDNTEDEETTLQDNGREKICQLNRDIQETQVLLTKTEQQKKKVDEELRKATNQLLECREKIKENETQSSHGVKSNHFIFQGEQMDLEKAAALEKKLLQEYNNIMEQLGHCDMEISVDQRNFYRALPHNELAGYLESVKFAKSRNWIEENVFYGILLDKVVVEPQYFKAVETVAGSQLYNILVKDQSYATQLAKHLKSIKQGVAVITPVRDIQRRFREPIVEIRKLGLCSTNDVVPLLCVMSVEEQVAPALTQVFGGYLLLKNFDLQLVQTLASKGYNCVTMEGDLISSKGTLKGGFRSNISRLHLKELVKKKQKVYEDLKDKQRETKDRLDELREAQTIFMIEQASFNSVESVTQKKHSLVNTVLTLERAIQSYRENQHIFNTALTQLQFQLDTLQCEALRLQKKKTGEESNKSRLTILEKERVKKQFNDLTRQKIALEQESKTLEEDFNLNHQKQRLYIESCLAWEKENGEQLLKEIDKTVKALNEMQVSFQLLEKEKNHLEQQIRHVEECHALCKETLKTLADQEENVIRTLETLQEECSQINFEKNSVQDKMNAFQIKQAILETRQRAGIGFDSQIAELMELDESQLALRLSTIVEKLSRFTYVNRRASDHCTSIIQEQSALLKSRETLYSAEDGINRLIENLDQQKDFTLLKTFENVNTQFYQVFRELVPGGRGKLVLKKIPKTGEANKTMETEYDPYNQNESNSQATMTLTEDIITGLDIKVRFPSSRNYVSLHQLSGGQKSTVALALIFALQRVEAAPFYVLDEVDASLDAHYRGAVAQLMKQQAEQHQMIVISHKKAMIQAAHWFIKTEIVGGTIQVTPTTMEDALALAQFSNDPINNSSQQLLPMEPASTAPPKVLCEEC
ncbi:uncharacterized protein LOC128882972 isoform X2 [Hylaeus volcanicus]|uniref:uncharacterized protein LOC128882972 isoform X2 n=1 Tax=Hylaeus volcanicus TaxID=313075 RepID=UPI0023B77483|nr:uncharacterized protein LOC128882972 isoform X2 [Hylaeus volcanicus]